MGIPDKVLASGSGNPKSLVSDFRSMSFRIRRRRREIFRAGCLLVPEQNLSNHKAGTFFGRVFSELNLNLNLNLFYWAARLISSILIFFI